jgi:hypothetical protein
MCGTAGGTAPVCSGLCCICVLILQYMCPQTTIYVSSYPLHVGGHVRHCRRHCAIGEIDIANIGKRCAIANCRVTKKVVFFKKKCLYVCSRRAAISIYVCAAHPAVSGLYVF